MEAVDNSLEIGRRQFQSTIRHDPLLSSDDKDTLTQDSFFVRYSFYYLVTESFKGWFPDVAPRRWSLVTQACFFSFLFVRSLDDILDGCPPERRLLLHRRVASFHAQAQRCLAEVFPNEPSFWSELAAIYEHYFEIMAQEDDLKARQVEWDLEEYFQHAIDKSCMIAIIPTVLHGLAASSFSRERVKQSLLQHHIAIQIIDDLDDIGEDLVAGRPSYYAQLLINYLHGQGVEIDPTGDADLLKRYLYVSGVANSGYREIITRLRMALATLPTPPSSYYPDYLRSQIEVCERRIAVVDSLVTAARDAARANLVSQHSHLSNSQEVRR